MQENESRDSKPDVTDKPAGPNEAAGIELRSEKVRSIIGEVPPGPVRWGTAVVALILAFLIAAAYWLPYPETVTAQATVMPSAGRTMLSCTLPAKYRNRIHRGMTAAVSASDGTTIQARITAVQRLQPENRDSGTLKVTLLLQDDKTRMPSDSRMTVSFLLKDKSFWEYLRGK